MEECIEVLESSESALPTDKKLCHQVRLQHIDEEIGYHFSMDDPSATITISDSRVQRDLRKFEERLREWRNNVPRDEWDRKRLRAEFHELVLLTLVTESLEYNEFLTSLYMHEIALHTNHNVDDFRAPFSEESIRANSSQSSVSSAAHSSALTQCLRAVQNMFDLFLAFDMDVKRALPVFYFVRVAYAVLVLVKLHFAINSPFSEIASVINPAEVRIEERIESILQSFVEIDKLQAFRPPNKPIEIFSKLKDWFSKNANRKPAAADPPRGRDASPRGHKTRQEASRPIQQHDSASHSGPRGQEAQTARYNDTTPLHFLSDVATTTNQNPYGVGPAQGPGPFNPTMAPQSQVVNNWQSGMGAMPASSGATGPMPADMNDFNWGGFDQALDTFGMTDPELAGLLANDSTFGLGGYLEGVGGGGMFSGGGGGW